jgi:hypothetical protein
VAQEAATSLQRRLRHGRCGLQCHLAFRHGSQAVKSPGHVPRIDR